MIGLATTWWKPGEHREEQERKWSSLAGSCEPRLATDLRPLVLEGHRAGARATPGLGTGWLTGSTFACDPVLRSREAGDGEERKEKIKLNVCPAE